jgi:hypothetical protein
VDADQVVQLTNVLVIKMVKNVQYHANVLIVRIQVFFFMFIMKILGVSITSNKNHNPKHHIKDSAKSKRLSPKLLLVKRLRAECFFLLFVLF